MDLKRRKPATTRTHWLPSKATPTAYQLVEWGKHVHPSSKSSCVSAWKLPPASTKTTDFQFTIWDVPTTFIGGHKKCITSNSFLHFLSLKWSRQLGPGRTEGRKISLIILFHRFCTGSKPVASGGCGSIPLTTHWLVWFYLLASIFSPCFFMHAGQSVKH